MAVIDERVVEMKFDRADFLKGTEETLGALQRLETSLGSGGAIASGVNHIGQAFGILGNVGMGALLKIGSSAVEAGMSVVNNVLTPIREGGKRRAMNLEQADFMLNNLLKSEEAVKAVMDDVSYAVTGTAYGLDAAAVAAAQFASSQVQAGTEMKNALRGISGLAAMGGREYEQVSNIFTKIAGQGRLMGDDLNRVGAMGVNAARTLADYYNELHNTTTYTEESVRKMVTDSQVSFKDFAAAMDGAFGEDAKRANEMYSGSLSNVRAALSRVGAAFYEVHLEKQRRTFVALIPVVDAVLAAIKPLFSIYEEFVAIPAAERIERWSGAMQNWLSKNLEPLQKILSELFMIGIRVRDMFSSWTKPVGDAFKAVFMSGEGGGWLESIAEWLGRAREGIENLGATAEQQSGLTDFFIRVFEAVKTLGDYIGMAFEALGPVVDWFWEKFKIGLDYVQQGFEWLQPYLQAAWDGLLEAGPKIKAFFDEFREHLSETGSLFETVGHYAKIFYDKYLAPLVEGIRGVKDAFVALREEGVTEFKSSLGDALGPLQGVWDWIKESLFIFDGFKDAIQGVYAWVQEKMPSIGNLIVSVTDYVSGELGGLVSTIDGVFDVIGSVLSGLAGSISDMLDRVDGEDLIKIAESLGKLLTVIMAFRTLSAMKGTFDSISGFFDNVGGSITAAIEGFTARADAAAKSNNFLKVAIAIGILAAALWVLSKIPADRIASGVIALASLSGVIVLMTMAMSKIENKDLIAMAFGMMLLAGAITGMAVAMVLLGLVPIDVLLQGIVALGMIVIFMTSMAAIIGKFAPNLNIAALGLLLMAGAITLMIVPLQILGEMDHVTLAQGLLGVLAVLALLVAAAVVLSEMEEQMLMGAISLAIIAGALTLMVIPIQQLGEMTWGEMFQGLAGIAIGLTFMALAAKSMEANLKGAAGVFILAAAMVVLAYAIGQLAAIPFWSAAGGLLILAAALGVLIGAAALAQLVLPGILGLAGLMLAFAAAAIAIALAVLIFASAAGVLAAGLPALADALTYFSEQMAQADAMGFKMMALGVVLAVFGVGAGIAGIGVGVLGIGLLALGIGMLLVTAVGADAAPVLVAFVEAIAPLWKQSLKLAAVAVALLAVGVAVLALGIGLAALGVGIAILGAGSLVLALGMATVMLAALGIDFIVTEFEKLPRAAEALVTFQTSAVNVSPKIATLAFNLERAASAASDFSDTFERMSSMFSTLSSSAATASTEIVDSVSKIGPGMSAVVSEIKDSTDQIVTAITTMSSRVKAAAPTITGSISGMTKDVSREMSSGARDVERGSQQIENAFDKMESGIKGKSSAIESAVKSLMREVTRTLNNSKGDVQKAVKSLADEIGKMSISITQNRSKVTSAVTSLTNSVVISINNQRGRVYSASSSVGSAVASGMAAGIRGGSSRVSSAARGIAQSAISSAERTLGIRSPSTVFYDIMGWTIAGMVNSAKDNHGKVESAGTMLGAALTTSVRNAMQDVSAEFGDFDIVPTISPLLDMSDVRRQAESLGGVDARLSRSQASGLASLEDSLRGVESTTPSREGATLTFVQNNTSPKALSEEELYRKSKNGISALLRSREN